MERAYIFSILILPCYKNEARLHEFDNPNKRGGVGRGGSGAIGARFQKESRFPTTIFAGTYVTFIECSFYSNLISRFFEPDKVVKLKFQVDALPLFTVETLRVDDGCACSGQRHLGDAKSNALHLSFAAFGHEWNMSFQFLGLQI